MTITGHWWTVRLWQCVCASGCWCTVAGHEWHSECGDSVSDIIKGHIIGVQALCVLRISMCHVPSASTTDNGPLVFQPPTCGVYQSKCDTLSPVCFPLCSVLLLFWAVTGCLDVFYWKISLHLDADPAMLVNAGSVMVYWWGSKTTSMVFMVKLVDIAR